MEMRTVEFRLGEVVVSVTAPASAGRFDVDLWLHEDHGEAALDELIEAIGGVGACDKVLPYEVMLRARATCEADSFGLYRSIPDAKLPPPANPVAARLAKAQAALKAEASDVG